MVLKDDWVDQDTPGHTEADWTYTPAAANAVAQQVNTNTSGIAAKYTKPGGGIPSSDLTTAVQTSLSMLAGIADVAADGETDDRAAVVAALSAASAGDTVRLPPGTILNGGAVVVVPAGVNIEAAGATLTTWIGNGLQIGDNTSIRHMGFDGTLAAHPTGEEAAIRISYYGTAPATGWCIEHCQFANWWQGVWSPTTNGGNNTYGAIRHNRFADCETAIQIMHGDYLDVSHNYSVNAVDTGRHIVANAGRGSVFHANTLVRGVTGIMFIASRNVAGGDAVRGNIISANTITDSSGEGISFDCAAGVAATTNVIDWGTVASTSYNAGTHVGTIVLDAAFNGIANNKWWGYWLAVTDGAAAGLVVKLTSNTDNSFNTEDVYETVWDLIAPGDEVVIGTPFISNTVTGNTVARAGTMAITVWGFGIGNTIIGNTVYGYDEVSDTIVGWTDLEDPDIHPEHGIELWGLDVNAVSTENYTTRQSRLPVVGNTIIGNAVHNAAIVNRCFTWGTWPPYDPRPNTIADNTFVNAVLLEMGGS